MNDGLTDQEIRELVAPSKAVARAAQTWRLWDVHGVQRLVRVAPCPYGGSLWSTLAERGDPVARHGLHEVPACAVMEHAVARGWDVRRLEPVGAS